MSGFELILTPSSSSTRYGPPIVPICFDHHTDVVTTPLLMLSASTRAAITFESLSKPLASASSRPATSNYMERYLAEIDEWLRN